jgi:hypothetical protein
MSDSDRDTKWEDGKSETYTHAISFPFSPVRFVGNLTPDRKTDQHDTRISAVEKK